MRQDCFRHDSIERLSSPSQLSQLLIVIRLKGWIALFTMIVLILVVLIWSLLGQIPIIVTGRGILLTPDAQFPLRNATEGFVSDVLVKNGDQISQGGALVSLSTGEVIRAPKDCKVIQIDASKGEQVKAGTILIWIQTQIFPSDFKIYGFIPIQAGERIQKGMYVTADLASVDTAKYGQLVGTVEDVTPYAVADNSDQLKVIPSEKLREDLTKATTAILVTIQPELDPKSKTGMKWSFGEGPPDRLSPGGLASVRITIERKRPISYLIPIFD